MATTVTSPTELDREHEKEEHDHPRAEQLEEPTEKHAPDSEPQQALKSEDKKECIQDEAEEDSDRVGEILIQAIFTPMAEAQRRLGEEKAEQLQSEPQPEPQPESQPQTRSEPEPESSNESKEEIPIQGPMQEDQPDSHFDLPMRASQLPSWEPELDAHAARLTRFDSSSDESEYSPRPEQRTDSFYPPPSLHDSRSDSVYPSPPPIEPPRKSIYRPFGLARMDSDVLPRNAKSAHERLLNDVADILKIPRANIDTTDSFVDLGGDERAAELLQETCEAHGVNVKKGDVLQCATLAELQTRVKPCIPSTAPAPLVIPSTIKETTMLLDKSPDASRGDNSSSNEEDEGDGVFTDQEPQGRSSNSITAYSSGVTSRTTSSDSNTGSQPAKTATLQNLEQLLMSTSKVGKACVITPRAGPFDGQLVAFFTAGAIAHDDAQDISLLPVTEQEESRRHVQTLKTAVKEWGGQHPKPSVWIPLRSMALTEDGQPDERRLRTFIQNVNETVEASIMDFQLGDPQKRTRKNNASIQPPPRGPWQDSPDEKTGVVQSDNSRDIQFFPLSPMQQLYFRTSMNRGSEARSMSDPSLRFSQSILLQIRAGVDLTDVEAAVESLVSRHSMLRARFRLTNEGWAQIITPMTPSSYRFGHHNAPESGAVVAIIETAQAAVNVSSGPVFAVEHIRSSGNKQLLYVVAHHLVVDLNSWRIIVHDLDELLQRGGLLSTKSIPFPNWIEYQSYETSQRLVEPILPFEITPANATYWQIDEGQNCYGDTEQLSFTLDADLTAALQHTCNAALRTESSDLFLTALLLSFCKTFPDRDAPTLWNQESGRESKNPDFNIDQTVGWFTTLCPLRVPVRSSSGFVQLLKIVKDTRRSIPRQGIPFFTSEFSAAKSPFNVIPVEVMFNCVDTLQQLTRTDGVLEPASLPDRTFSSLASDVGSEVGRIALFEFSVVMEHSGTRVEMLYNKSSSRQDGIRSWVQNFEQVVLDVIVALRDMEPELTLSDAPLLKASYEGMSKLTTERVSRLGLDNVHAIETVFPASPEQQEILIAQGRDVDTFHVRSIYELATPDGSLVDQARLCTAWETLVQSNATLRSVFIDSVSKKGIFDQVILRKISPAMLFLDASSPEEMLASLPALRTLPSQPRHRLSVCKTPDKTFIRIDASQAICDVSFDHMLESMNANRLVAYEYP